MNNLITSVMAGFTAFTATNLDDVVILLLFFSQVNAVFQRRHIVAGQYLGFIVLVMVSLPSFFSSMLLPRPWIGLLGIVPIAIGISRLLNPDTEEEPGESEPQSIPLLGSILSPQTYSVAAITFANGGDNVGIYMPLFASSNWQSLWVILGVFFLMVGVWCYMAYQLTKVPAIAETLTRYGNSLVPFILIGLGSLILIDSHTLENRGLAVITSIICCLCFLTLGKSSEQAVMNLQKSSLIAQCKEH